MKYQSVGGQTQKLLAKNKAQKAELQWNSLNVV